MTDPRVPDAPMAVEDLARVDQPGFPYKGRIGECVDISLGLPPNETRAAVVEELSRFGFRTTFSEPWHGIAERGRRGWHLVLGPWCGYYRISVELFDGGSGTTVVRLLQHLTGSGLVSRSRVRSVFEKAKNGLVHDLSAQGFLVEVTCPQLTTKRVR